MDCGVFFLTFHPKLHFRTVVAVEKQHFTEMKQSGELLRIAHLFTV